MKAIRTLLAGIVVAFAAPTQASLIGDTVTCSSNFGCNPPSAVVGAGPEFNLGGTLFFVDVGASSITFVFTSGVPIFVAISTAPQTLGSLDDSAGDIIGISNFVTAGTTGISGANVSTTAHSVTFDIGNSGWQVGASASFNLVVAPRGVPEPASLALLGIGFAAFTVTRRSKWLRRAKA